jgi:hypothetical protein
VTQYGKLTVIKLIPGRKCVHPVAECVCECGNKRTVRQTALRTGKIGSCARCSMKKAWTLRPRTDAKLRKLCNKESEYKANAKGRGLKWEIGRSDFQRLILAACYYCGVQPSNGLDRIDNTGDYSLTNIYPCCSQCNYAKRNQTFVEFLAWVDRITSFRGRL